MCQSVPQHSTQIDFISLGMPVLDDIYFANFLGPHEPILGQLGGAGPYAAIGARIVAGKARASRVGLIATTGHDFPDSSRHQLNAYGVTVRERNFPSSMSTRARTTYFLDGHKDEKFLTERLQIGPELLDDVLLASRCFHIMSSPGRCTDLVKGIVSRRSSNLRPVPPQPRFIWEPVPYACTPDQKEACLQAARSVDIVSPNYREFSALHGRPGTDEYEVLNHSFLRGMMQQWTDAGVGEEGKGIIVVRCGRLGSVTLGREFEYQHTPAYVFSPDRDQVKDPTGAGNAFLGALGMAIACQAAKNVSAALIEAHTAASFVVQQFGMPELSYDERGIELWNGETVEQRTRELQTWLDAR